MSRVPWKDGKVVSIETREGTFVLAQMLKDPYIMFFDLFRDEDSWTDVIPDDLPTLYCAGATRQFISRSNVVYQKKLRPASFDNLPDKWIKPLGDDVVRTIWQGTSREMTVGYMGGDGGWLYRQEIYESYEEAWGDHEVIMKSIPFDDHETIDNHELDILITHPTENERLYLCYEFGRNVDPTKDLMFQRELPAEYERYMCLIAED